MQNKILAALFASGESVEAARLAEALDIAAAEARSLACALSEWLDESGCALQVRQLGDSFQLCTRVGYGDFIRQVLDMRRATPLSSAALEVLAVVAYNQPVTRGFIEQVRGVDSSGVVSSLEEKGLIEEAGRLELPGRPIAYRTTDNFLRCFGMSRLTELPEVQVEEEEPEDDGQLTLEGPPEPEGESAAEASP